MIGTPKKTFEILKKHGFTFKKSLGQNFLIDANILNRIVDGAGVNGNVGVIEIGPGIGSLTEALAKKAKKVISFEIDGRLLPILSDTHLIENTEKIDGYVVMMQKEVANRLNAKVGTKDYNSLTILLNYYTDVEYLFTVPKKVFVPAPNVESAVVKIMTKETREFETDAKFFKFVRSCFVQRRKTLLNNLISSYGKDKKQDLQNACVDSDIEPVRRSETLSLAEFYNLYNNLTNNSLI